jgi:hypothetical protein
MTDGSGLVDHAAVRDWTLVDIETLIGELRRRGWVGSDKRDVTIDIEWDQVRVSLRWQDEAGSKWGHVTDSSQSWEAPTLAEALALVLDPEIAPDLSTEDDE